MNFLTFSKFFILFILHIANKPSNKKKVQSHLHTAIYSNCPSYEKTAMIAAVFLLFDFDRLQAVYGLVKHGFLIFCADDGKRFFQKHRDPVHRPSFPFNGAGRPKRMAYRTSKPISSSMDEYSAIGGK